MEIKEIEVIKKEKIYTLTESELEALKNKERNYAAPKIKEYIAFGWDHYIFEKSISGAIEFGCDVMKFVHYERNGIQNIYDLSFGEWLKHNNF